MKGRPEKQRIIRDVPTISGMDPIYINPQTKSFSAIILSLEEYETLRLSDYENLNQTEAAEVMGISRPTFTRIYMKARKHIAEALVEGRHLTISGGNITLSEELLKCKRCGAIFSPKNGLNKCALCSSLECIPYNEVDEVKHFKPCCRHRKRNTNF